MNTRDLFREALRLQEEERRKIARELHDQVGQYLTAIGLLLKALQSRTEGDPALADMVEQLREMTGQLSRRTHTLALELRPPELDQLGLVQALESYLEDHAPAAHLQARVEAAELDGMTLDPETGTAVFRAVQEAFTNVIQHARAREVAVTMAVAGDRLCVAVRDDGRGFDPEAVLADRSPARRLGILGMQERLLQVGGTLTVDSTPGQGSTVRIDVPLTGRDTPPA